MAIPEDSTVHYVSEGCAEFRRWRWCRAFVLLFSRVIPVVAADGPKMPGPPLREVLHDRSTLNTVQWNSILDIVMVWLVG